MRKLLLSILSLLTVSLLGSAVMAYPDVPSNHWAAKQINELSEQGVVVGYPDGTFKPDELVTRAEFASMAIKALGQEISHNLRNTEIDQAKNQRLNVSTALNDFI